jgi:C4-dicarboxylate transporter, DctM subunit
MDSSLVFQTTLCLGLVLTLIGVGMRIWVCMIVAAIFPAYFLLDTLEMTAFIPFSSANSWTLAAMPLFVFMGTICLYGGLSDGLYKGATILIGGLRGGLLHSNIIACALFSAISGSTTATAVTVGSVAIPELDKRGYAPAITGGSLAAGSILGSIIPPSTIFIIYGSMTNTSIGKLFFAGMLPGFTLAALYMVVIYIWVTLDPSAAPQGKKEAFLNFWQGIRELMPILVTSGIVLGGIYFGLFTPVEGGAVGCIVAIIASLLIGRLSWSAMHKAALGTIKTTTFLMLIIVGSSVLANVLAALRIPFSIAQWITHLDVSPMGILLAFCLMYLVLGCVIESIPLLVMTLPLVFPVAKTLGFDPVWFGVIICLLIQIAMITPPVGLSLFAVNGLRENGNLMDVIRGTMPFLIAALFLLAIVIIFPPLSTWLPSYMME